MLSRSSDHRSGDSDRFGYGCILESRRGEEEEPLVAAHLCIDSSYVHSNTDDSTWCISPRSLLPSSAPFVCGTICLYYGTVREPGEWHF
jgi:hypothetical protein